MYRLYTLQYNVHVPCVLWWCDGYHIGLAIKSLLRVHIICLEHKGDMSSFVQEVAAQR